MVEMVKRSVTYFIHTVSRTNCVGDTGSAVLKFVLGLGERDDELLVFDGVRSSEKVLGLELLHLRRMW
jgi:hypothetical protein